MATQVQRRKGTTTQHSTFTGASAELTVDTTKNTVVVHDGVTAGGTPLAKESGSALSPASLTLPNGTANGVAYLNGSKVLTSGSALTFDGTSLSATGSILLSNAAYYSGKTTGGANIRMLGINAGNIAYVGPIDSGPVSSVLNASPSVTYTAFYASGSEQMRLNSTGLGIGTSSPAAKLNVKGGTTISTLAGWNTLSNSMFELANPAVRFGIGYDSSDQVLLQGFDSSNAARNIGMQVYGGNVGIGTRSPTDKLHVVGLARINTGTYSAGYGLTFQANSETSRTYQMGMVTGGAFAIYDSAAAAQRVVLDSSGNLGLGVTPSASTRGKGFDIGLTGGLYGDGITVNFSTHLTNNAYPLANGNWVYKNSSQVAQRYSMESSGQHQWYTAPSGTAGDAIGFTQAMTLDASGNFLVGTTSASGSNSGSFYFIPGTGSFAGVAVFQHSTSNSSGSGYVNFNYNGSAIGSISQNGTTGVSYNTTSDYRLKNVIGPVSNAGDRIDALEPVEYEWKTDGSRTRGFLAHKFQEVYAGSVTGTKDAVDAEGKPVYQAMQASSSEVIADLVAEIQSLRQRLAAAGI